MSQRKFEDLYHRQGPSSMTAAIAVAMTLLRARIYNDDRLYNAALRCARNVNE